jgi:hypothetical protein
LLFDSIYKYLIVMPYPGVGGGAFIDRRRRPICWKRVSIVGPPSRVYARDSQIIAYLKLGIRVEFFGVLVRILGRDLGNTLSRLDDCSFRGRGHFENIFLEN